VAKILASQMVNAELAF